MKIDPNLPAFPRPSSQCKRSDGAIITDEAESGISIRTLIAKDLMAGMLANPNTIDPVEGMGHLAKVAVESADSLIAQLNK